MTVAPLSRLTDTELQARIERFAATVVRAGKRFDMSGDLVDRVARDQAWIAQRSLLKERGRRARIVRRMEQERNLSTGANDA